ncbi:hypothetical protein FS837_012419 [Tulasnella sp. UAMH 9824]|nr:hypothetical protein FS837_012419 [Tulasnella sp. UAMH 9824]
MEYRIPAQAEFELSSTPIESSQATRTQCSPAAVKSPCNKDGTPHRSRIDVPPELLIIIFEAFLSIVDPMSLDWKGACKEYIESLFSLRLVSRTWRDILDDTPSVWVVLTSTVPLSVNHTNITRSGGAPLIIHFGDLGDSFVQPEEFAKLVGPIRDRWKEVCVDEGARTAALKCLTSPTPMLETVRLHTYLRSGAISQPLELLGGETRNIRHLDLHGSIVNWNRSTFHGLKHLRLAYVDRYGLTMDMILEILADSPDLEYLYIDSMTFPVSAAPPLLPILLPHLRTIELLFLPGNVIFPLLRHIEAPHCQRVRIQAENVRNTNEWVEESMGSFEPLLREMHEKSGRSQLIVSPGFVDWKAPFKRGSDKHGYRSFEVQIRSDSFVSLLRWIERVVGGGDLEGLEMKVCITGENRLPDPEITSILQRIRNVTELRAYQGPENSQEMVRFLCDLDDNTIPFLLSLRVLHIDYEYIAADEILLILRTRLNACADDGGSSKLPHLDVVVELPVEARPEPTASLDFAIIAQIRAIPGVTFTLTRPWEYRDTAGMCAIVWDDERGVARWM